jgi:hypothetical protein
MLRRLVRAVPIRDIEGVSRFEVGAGVPFALAARRPYGFRSVEKDHAARSVVGRYHDGLAFGRRRQRGCHHQACGEEGCERGFVRLVHAQAKSILPGSLPRSDSRRESTAAFVVDRHVTPHCGILVGVPVCGCESRECLAYARAKCIRLSEESAVTPQKTRTMQKPCTRGRGSATRVGDRLK